MPKVTIKGRRRIPLKGKNASNNQVGWNRILMPEFPPLEPIMSL